MSFRGITAVQAHQLLSTWKDDIDKRGLSLKKGARVYNALYMLSLPILATTTVLVGLSGAALSFYSKNGTQYIPIQVLGAIVLVATIIHGIILAVKEGFNTRQKGADCGSASKKCNMFSELISLHLLEIQNNIGNKMPSEALMHMMRALNFQEDLIKMDEPSLVWFGHNNTKIVKTLAEVYEIIQKNKGILPSINDDATWDEKMHLFSSMVNAPLTIDAVHRLGEKVQKYSAMGESV
jgi:hypothetical protein